MLPFPIFVLVLFSVTLLAPTPTLLIAFIRSTLQSSVWNTLPVPVKSSGSVPPPDAAPLLPALFSEVTLDAVPTRCGPSPMHVAPNNTIPHSFVDGRITCAVVLLVVSLATFSCLVYKRLVNNSDGKHNAEGSSESLMSSPCLTLAASPSQELKHVQKVNVMTPLLLSIDTSKSTTGSFEPERPPCAVTVPPFSSFEVAVLATSSIPEQPVPFLQVLTREFSFDNSEKETDGDLSPLLLQASDSTLVDPPSDSVTQSPDLETLSTSPVVSAVEIDDSKPELPQSTLDTEAVKDDSTTLPLLDASDISHPPEQEPGSEPHNDCMSPPAIEDTSELDAEGNEAFHYQPYVSESRDEETFDYQGVDWTEETLESPLALATEDQDPSPHPSARPNNQCLDPVPSLSAETSTPDVADTRNFSRSLLPFPSSEVTPRRAPGYASDDIQVGLKDQGEGKRAFVTRCSSADDLSSKFKTTKTVHALIINDDDHIDHTAILRHDIIDNDTSTAHNQITILRADAPVFEPLSSGTEAVLLPGLSSVGLKASIHAPRDEISQMVGCVAGVSESMHATRRACAPVTTSGSARDSPEPSSEDDEFQASADVAEEPKSSEDAAARISIMPGVTSGIHASIHAPQPSSTTAHEAHDDATDTLGKTTPARMRSNSSPTDKSTQSGLSASIHARRASQDAQPTATHTADAPNWAAAAREQDSESSTSPGSRVQAERSNSPGAALDEDAPELQLPTTTATRCAANDQQQEDGSVDNPDRYSDHAADDQDEDGTASTGQTDNGLDEADDPATATNDQLEGSESASSTRPQQPETHSRGKKSSRRSRQKVPYLPPPRMRYPNTPPFGVLAAQMHTPTPNAVAAAPPAPSSGQYYRHTPSPLPPPAASSGQYYRHTPPPPPPPLLHRPNSAPYPMVSPSGSMPNRLEQHPPYHHPQYLGSPHRPEQHPLYYQPQHIGSPSHMAVSYPPPVPGFQPPPGPYYPTGYFHGPHHQQLSLQAPLYGR